MTPDENWIRQRGFVPDNKGGWVKPEQRLVNPHHSGSRASVQKSQASGDPKPLEQSGQADGKKRHRARGQRADARNRQQYRVTALFYLPDYRRRDLSGMFETVLDCLVAARRLLDSHQR